ERIYGFATIPKSGWKVYAGIPTSFVLAAARANTWRASVAAGALFVLIMGLVILLSRLINEPVSALFRAATAAAEGRAESPGPTTGPQEISTVAAAFHRTLALR